MRILLLFFFLIGTVSSLHAQSADSLYLLQLEQTMDSLERVKRVVEEVQKYEERLLKEEMRFHYNDGAVLLRGLIQTGTNHGFIEHEGFFPKRDFEVQDYAVASLPLVSAWTLKALGVESRSKTRRMLTANVLALAIAGSTVEGLKYFVREERPNGKNDKSFPSGHSALAFASATILDREFGYISPWISVGGYTAATAAEWLRLRHNAHYVNDIFTGAGIGIVSTNLAYFLTDCIFGEEAINRPRFYTSDIVRLGRFLDQPVSLSLLAGSEITSKHISMDGIDLRTSSTYTAGFQYSYFFDKHWALDADARLSTTQVKADLHDSPFKNSDIQANTLSQYHLNLGLRYSVPLGLNARLAFRAFGGECYTEQVDFLRFTTSAHDVSVPFLSIPRRWNAEVGGGLSFEAITTKNYVTGFSADYVHSFSNIFPNRCFISSYWKILL